MSNFNQSEYIKEYTKKHYKQLKIYLSEKERERIQRHAASLGESVGAFLRRAAAAQIERDAASGEAQSVETAASSGPPAVAPDSAGGSETSETSETSDG